jgi:hypothetical protein
MKNAPDGLWDKRLVSAILRCMVCFAVSWVAIGAVAGSPNRSHDMTSGVLMVEGKPLFFQRPDSLKMVDVDGDGWQDLLVRHHYPRPFASSEIGYHGIFYYAVRLTPDGLGGYSKLSPSTYGSGMTYRDEIAFANVNSKLLSFKHWGDFAFDHEFIPGWSVHEFPGWKPMGNLFAEPSHQSARSTLPWGFRPQSLAVAPGVPTTSATPPFAATTQNMWKGTRHSHILHWGTATIGSIRLDDQVLHVGLVGDRTDRPSVVLASKARNSTDVVWRVIHTGGVPEPSAVQVDLELSGDSVDVISLAWTAKDFAVCVRENTSGTSHLRIMTLDNNALQLKQGLSYPSERLSAMFEVDFNNDYLSDLVFSDGAGSLIMLLNTGGNLREVHRIPVNGFPWAAVVGKYQNKSVMFVADLSSGHIHWYELSAAFLKKLR